MSTKVCNKCLVEKPTAQFYKNHNHCKTCKHYWTEDARMRKAYGMTLSEFDVALENQGGKCAICKGTDPKGKRFCVDHNHETGQVRGILCNGCNSMLGKSGDSPNVLLAGYKYLMSSGWYGE